MGNELYLKMKEFYDVSPLAQKVAAPLKEGAVAELEFEGDPETYLMIKEGGKSVVRPGKPKRPEIYMKFNAGAVAYLLELAQEGKEDIEEYISRFGECILNPTPQRKIEFKLCANLVTGARMGYFGMMRLGGKKALNLALRLGIQVPKKFLK